MRENGLLDDIPKYYSDEYIVRALMVRHFGDIEMGLGEKGDQQVNFSKTFVPANILDKIEKRAAGMISQETPRGPR